MDRKTRLAEVFRELRAFGVEELFLDELTAPEALRLAALETATRPEPESGRAAPDETASAGVAVDPGPTTSTGGGALHVLGAQAAGCTRCRLAEGRTQVVFGRGTAQAEVVVVGEAPGAEEDRQGFPFVGPAGRLLDLLLLSVGLDRDAVYICNVLKCRPPNNRDPMADEVQACSSWLHGQLETIGPSVLLAVGKFAAQMLTGSETTIGRIRGRVHAYRGIPVVATYHPAYLLRSPDATRKTWQDFQLMRQVLDESR